MSRTGYQRLEDNSSSGGHGQEEEYFLPSTRRNCTDLPCLIIAVTTLIITTATALWGASYTFSKYLSGDIHLDEDTVIFLRACWEKIWISLEKNWWLLLTMGISILLLSTAAICLFRFCSKSAIWVITYFILIMSIIFSWFAWYEYVNLLLGNSRWEYLSSARMFVVIPITATVLTLIFVVLVCMCKPHINHLTYLFEETVHVCRSIPHLFLVPLVAKWFLFIINVIYMSLIILNFICGTVVSSDEYPDVYHVDPFFAFNVAIMLIVTYWLNVFAFSCQHFIIAGAVGKWYFTRDKKRLVNTTLKSVTVMLDFHLGTVALGSLFDPVISKLQTLFWVIRASHLKKFMVYLSKNAFIVTAVKGSYLWKAGKQAFLLFFKNLPSALVLNVLGGAILCVCEFVIVIVPIGISSGIYYVWGDKDTHAWITIAIGSVIAIFMVNCFLVVIETVMDTLFLCYCMDCEENNEHTKPDFLKSKLFKFIVRSKAQSKVVHGRAQAQEPSGEVPSV